MVGTPIAVQQKLMRHTDTRTTMNLYGDVVTDAMAQADSKVVGLALSNSDSRMQSGSEVSQVIENVAEREDSITAVACKSL